MITARVSLPGYDALSDTDPKHFSLFADEDNILIKEFARGTVSVANSGVATIAHNLGYAPHVYVYCQIPGSKYALLTGYNIFGQWRTYADNTNLYILNQSGVTASARYFIFYDNIN